MPVGRFLYLSCERHLRVVYSRHIERNIVPIEQVSIYLNNSLQRKKRKAGESVLDIKKECLYKHSFCDLVIIELIISC